MVRTHVYLPFSVLIPVGLNMHKVYVCFFWLLIYKWCYDKEKKHCFFCHFHFLLHKNLKAVSQMSFIKLDSAMLTVLKDQNSIHCYENSKVKEYVSQEGHPKKRCDHLSYLGVQTCSLKQPHANTFFCYFTICYGLSV